MRSFVLAAAAALTVSVAPASAQSYDAFASFNGTQGAGNFLYFAQEIGTGELTPLSPTTNNCGALGGGMGLSCLDTPGGPNDGLPGVYKSADAFAFSTVNVPNDQLLFHPGPTSRTLAAFLAPEAGFYDFSAVFNILDVRPTGVALFTFNTADGLASSVLGTIDANNPSFTYAGRIALDAGELFGVGVGPLANYFNDSTGVSFVVTAVPEPATWGMMILGFGLAGGAMRRQRDRLAFA